MSQQSSEEQTKGPLAEISQPFIDLMHAPRALWGINLAYVLEGMVYFGMLGYLAIHFSDFIFGGMKGADEYSHLMVGVLTGGITLSMLFLGMVADKKGVRFALVTAFFFLLAGRVLISAAPILFSPEGVWSSLHITTMAGIFLVVIGYGMYQPAAYAGVRQFTTPKTAAMGFAMLYALMNLGGWLPSWAFLLRDDDFLGIGITGVFWVYTVFTGVALISTMLILTSKTVSKATTDAEAETARIKAEESEEDEAGRDEQAAVEERQMPPLHMWIFILVMAVILWVKLSPPWKYVLTGLLMVGWTICMLIPGSRRWMANHPLANSKFFFFIFALIPVQTLFTYNWFILPQFISRSVEGWIGEYFEFASNLNPILIFVAVPIITALTQKAKVYNMMILGTLIMAAPAFLLAIGPYWWTLLPYIGIMTIGEAMWQPRFLQYAAEIAPKGRTGEYMGVAQFPWFLTKVLVPLYSGWMIGHFCPAEGPKDTETMWLIFACIAMTSTVMLVVAKGWVGKDFKAKA